MKRYRVEFKTWIGRDQRYHVAYAYAENASLAVKVARDKDKLLPNNWFLQDVREAPELAPDRRLPREDD